MRAAYGPLVIATSRPRIAQRCPKTIRWLVQSSVSLATPAVKTKTVTNFDDLPLRALDSSGQPAVSLPAYKDSLRSGRSKKKGVKLARKEIPDTPLTREIFFNYKRFPGCIVLTRVGKFYESYFAPAVELSSILSLKLAYKRYQDGTWPFSGFPVSQRDKYLRILVQDLRQTVVLVEEYGERNFAGNLVTSGEKELKDRRVGRVVTPGTMLEEGWLDTMESRYLLSIAFGKTITTFKTDEESLPIHLAYTDVSTGEFFSKETTSDALEDELARITPREIVLDYTLKPVFHSPANMNTLDDLVTIIKAAGVHISFADPNEVPILDTPHTDLRISTQLPVTMSLEAAAISLLRHHLLYALRDSMVALPEPNRQSNTLQMQIDAATLHALEVRHAIRPGGMITSEENSTLSRLASPLSTRGTLLSVIDRSMTHAGHRLLIRTLTAPMTHIPSINSRLALVQAFVDDEDLRVDIRGLIKTTSDIVRVLQRFRSGRGEGRDVWEVGRWIRTVESILSRIREDLPAWLRNPPESSNKIETAEGADRLAQMVSAFRPLSDLGKKIEESIDETRLLRDNLAEEDDGDSEGGSEVEGGQIVVFSDGKRQGETRREQQERERVERENEYWWIRPAFSTELQDHHNGLLALQEQKEKLQKDLRLQTGAPSLLLVKGLRHGYHILLQKKAEYVHLDKSEMFEVISESRSTKAYAYGPWSALGAKTELAQEKLAKAQIKAADELRNMIINNAETIRHNASLIDELDLAMGFAQTAVDLDYVRPTLNTSTSMEIINGRHPSVESGLLSSARTFTPNSTIMNEDNHLHIITGPNQGGKSTLLRQTAVIAILAQSGCFVPADKATLGVVDKVFSRIGARDDLFRDRSTFMLEMVETASILRQATPRSLVIMDEIGRGTTLNAGISIAYATLDYILQNISCRTLFATHYHELARMLTENGRNRSGVQFWCTDVDEIKGAFSYSYKLRPGVNHDSHAIRAAQLAGMPPAFLKVAKDILSQLESKSA
ncbi:hypothetical protein TREMEDRAFT_70943 [Tremella mesenterica DSM 1558]|uniref:uncharacterized protein n=1 Tax=Tremella mesenterica (strain ATCC 24925 / CBS 8224 / DSM 1558 / NBRC 9311 / NRRL Y-6157 / RJB 2259-6 / UBC 559-6) TaxID=578456 RepID=UPI0003F490BC|nr:uncharacterized protein TREMEDRAFT_70943 [Tremella mesenterica DSM 1558]EIW73297.1 hypothetical protein TREMEDRAFT_70943 [Tremella mesenterica DSM 1558]